MVRKNQLRNNRRKTPPRRPLVPLLLVLLAIVAVVAFLEHLRRPATSPPAPPPAVVKPMPAKPPAVPMPTPTPAVEAPRPLPKSGGAVAVIVDDMGTRVQEARQLLAIGVPLTLAVIPGLPQARQVAEYAHSHGGEVIIHLPMEPKDYPQRPLEANGLLMAHADDEVIRRVKGYFQAIPHAVGANNHMGSRFTEDRARMALVLGVLRDRRVFFVDSLTSDHSVGYHLARELGVRTVRRNVFLDNVQDVPAVIRQLQEVADIARRQGSAVAICHPHPVTMSALARHLPVMQAAGTRFVPVSTLVH